MGWLREGPERRVALKQHADFAATELVRVGIPARVLTDG
jgi:hypothetical protein